MDEVRVRVAVRVRPLLPKELLQNKQVCVRVVADTSQVMVGTERAFSFDYAFEPTTSQDEVYEACVQPLVESLVRGYNATVFAYGQTGSGKTYTLGSGHVDEEWGITGRVAQDVFLLLKKKRQSGSIVEATVRVSYMELYREELRDLLELPTNNKDMHIRDDDRGNTVVTGAKETVVTSTEELLSILEAGNALRHTGPTAMNERSSRSHAILTLQLTQCCHDSGSFSSSKLHLVDLAGSERAGKMGNTGPRFKEATDINAGLLALSKVIRSLSDPRNRRGNRNTSTYIPYRDTKITRLLRDSLGGTAHTLMVACVSPSHGSVAETLRVLQFADRVRHIRNRPGATCCHTEVRSGPTAWDPGKARLEELHYEVQMLREALKEKEREMEGSVEGGSKPADLMDSLSDAERAVRQYRLLSREAAELLEVLFIPTLSPSLRHQIEDWQERLMAVNHSHKSGGEKDSLGADEDQPHHGTVQQLRQELYKCKEVLAIDQQLLEQKEEELRQMEKNGQKLLQENIMHLEALEGERKRTRIQTEQLIDQQILIERLRGSLAASGVSTARSRRPHSVPLTQHSCGRAPARKIHSSPPGYSLERVMAAFKMRGHLLLAEIEEKDHVYRSFSRQQLKETDGVEDGTMGFRRSLNRTWTSRNKKSPQKQNNAGLNHNCINEIQLSEQTQLAAGFKENQTKQIHLHKAGQQASATQRKIQELLISMRMKEELIKELDLTDKQAQAAGRNVGETNVLARLSLQSKQTREELHQSLQHMRQQAVQLQISLKQERETRETKEPPQNRGLSAQDVTDCQNVFIKDSKEMKDDWMEAGEEQALKRREELRGLEEEVRQRKEVLQHREACLQQRNKLQIKRLRSSQVLSQDLLRVSARLESLEEQLEGSSEAVPTVGVTTQELVKERDTLRQRRDALDAQLKDGRVLTPQEENSLLQLEEAMEALDAALEFKNYSIQDKQKQLSTAAILLSCPSHSTEPAHLCDVTRKLKELSAPEASDLLVKYFNKVVCLREQERRLRLHCEELQLQAEEQEAVVREMERAFQRLAMDTDRRLTQQHREHQTTIQLLLQHLKEGCSGDAEQAIQAKLQQIEKELFFYKSSSRQLKRKLKELLPQQPGPLSSHTETEQALVERNQPQAAQSSTSSNIQSYKNAKMPMHAVVNTRSQSQGTSVRGDGSSVEGLEMVPVCLSRKELRQISPADLHITGSSTQGRHSVVKTSTESLLEDSIEMPR